MKPHASQTLNKLTIEEVLSKQKTLARLNQTSNTGSAHEAVRTEELKKMTRIIQKNDEEAPHNKILVLDSTIGQNTYNQIDSFHQNIGLTGVIMTKLDGSAKGGSLIGITRKYNLPIHALGVGEKIDDLITFIPKDFINALLGDNIGEKK